MAETQNKITERIERLEIGQQKVYSLHDTLYP